MPREFIANIDTANEEIARLEGQLTALSGIASTPEFIPNIDTANEEIARLDEKIEYFSRKTATPQKTAAAPAPQKTASPFKPNTAMAKACAANQKQR